MAPKDADVEAPDVPVATKPKAKPFRGWDEKVKLWKRILFFDVDYLVAHGYNTRLEPQVSQVGGF